MTWYKVDGSKLEHLSSKAVGLTFRKTPSQDDLDECAVAPWDSFLLGTEDGEFVKVGQRYLPIYLHDERVLMPLEEERAVAVENLTCYRVDINDMLCNLSHDGKGLEYCKSSTLADRDANSVAPWGSLIWGTEQNDFVKVGRQYLPKHLDGQLVLVPDQKIQEPSDTVTELRFLRGAVTDMQSESNRYKDVFALQLNQHDEQIQELVTHLNETTHRVGAFESCLRKLSGLVTLCKDFENRLATHEQKLANQDDGTKSNVTELLTIENISEGEEDDDDSPKAGRTGDQNVQPQSASDKSNAHGVDAAKMWKDMQSHFHDFESKLDNHSHNLADHKSITQTFASRLETLESRLYELADNQLNQQRAVEVQHMEVRLMFSQLQADATKQQCEQVQQVQQLTSQQLEKAWGVLKAFPGKCLSRETPLSKSVDEPCTPLEPYTPMADDRSQLNDMDYRPSQPGTPLSLKAHRQVLSAIAPSSKGPRTSSPTQQPRTSSPPTYMRQSSPRQFDWQPRAGSRSVQLPSRDVSEAATPTIVLSAGRPPPSTSSTSTPRMRSISPRFSGGSARVPPRSPQQPLHNENKLGAPPPQRTSPYQRSTLTAMPANRNALNTRAASPGGPRVHTTQGPLPQQGFRTETVASPLAPFPAPQFISGRSALPGASAVMTPRELIKGGESWM